MAYWLYEHRCDVPIRLRVDVDSVALTGDLAFMQWIEMHRRDLAQVTWSPRVLSIASDRGDVAVVRWLLEGRMKNYPFVEECLSHALFYGWFPSHRDRCVVSYSVTRFPIPELHNGHLELIRWLNSDYKWKDESLRRQWIQKATVHAAALGDSELIQSLEESDPSFASKEARSQAPLWLAADHGNLVMVQWLQQHGSRLDGKIMDSAAAGGHVKILQWLLDNGDCNVQHNEAMYAAVRAEKRDAIHWLLEHRSAWTNAEGAMDLAAARGDLELLQLLHQNHVDGCTQSAMDNAASEGHLAVVQWLFANRSESCTAEAFESVVSRRHVAVAQFLHEYCGSCITSGMMWDAVGNGHLEMVRWLDTKRTVAWSPSAVDLARFAANAEVLELIDR